jgi:hypothetical protein
MGFKLNCNISFEHLVPHLHPQVADSVTISVGYVLAAYHCTKPLLSSIASQQTPHMKRMPSNLLLNGKRLNRNTQRTEQIWKFLLQDTLDRAGQAQTLHIH